jgi:hypothetical protein
MRTVTRRRPDATLAAMGLVLLGVGAAALAGDEPGVLGRLFRGSGGSNTARPAERFPAQRSQPSVMNARPTQPPPLLGLPASPAASLPASTPTAPGSSAATRIRPQPRVNRAATEADPILTRIALGRSDNGDQFGMFLQVYADGTVIDGEGIHRAGAEAMRPLVQILQSSELSRLRGHCGAPPTDFIEQVYVTVYERTKLGGLRANTFSFTGNPQGCDPVIRQLHSAIEALVTKLSREPGSTPPPTPTAPSAPAPTLSLTPAP